MQQRASPTDSVISKNSKHYVKYKKLKEKSNIVQIEIRLTINQIKNKLTRFFKTKVVHFQRMVIVPDIEA